MAMKKIDVLKWGLQHIAANYDMGADTEHCEDERQACIYVTEKHPDCSPAPINDVEMLCQDLGIKSENIENSPYGVDVYLDAVYDALQEDYVPTGHELWKRANAVIGD